MADFQITDSIDITDAVCPVTFVRAKVALEELEEVIPAGGSLDEQVAERELARSLDAFLAALPVNQRRVFLCRYWYFDSVGTIARRFGYSESKVKMMCKRTREKLLLYLRKEGIIS